MTFVCIGSKINHLINWTNVRLLLLQQSQNYVAIVLVEIFIGLFIAFISTENNKELWAHINKNG